MSPEYDPLADLDRELVDSTLSRESLGHLLLMGVSHEADPLSEYEQRYASLLDMQTRHSGELQEEGVLWRAYMDATGYDISSPDKALLDPSLPYRACVYRLRGTKNLVPTEVGGVRFITTHLDGSGDYSETHIDVPVYVNDKPRRGYGGVAIETVTRQVAELEAARENLHLRFDLAGVIAPKD